ncbi:MAG: M42 family metallopeptidase [Eggerthellaceae bacterium]|nr:M42 family metallopeptidase [Eggerthellaceae bacterium]
MNKKNQDFLKALTETPSPTGSEEAVAGLVRARLKGSADTITTDVLGSVHAVLQGRGNGPSVMVAAHLDEIGLMVIHISDKGFLSVAAIGGVDAAILPGLRVDVHTAQGVLRGVVGRKPVHLIEPDERKTVTALDKLVIDVGMPAEAVHKQVRVGDPITFGVGFEDFGTGKALARAFDDKVGLWVAIRVLEELKKAGCAQGDYMCVATVQEEIGVRGAQAATYAISPDVGLAIDVTHATDYPGIEQSTHGKVVCGEGPVIGRGPNINPIVFDRLVAAAEKEGIPYQIEAEPRVTPTDARAIQVTKDGRACGLISIPLRYMHTPTEVIDLGDAEAAVRLITRFVLDLDEKACFIPGMG